MKPESVMRVMSIILTLYSNPGFTRLDTDSINARINQQIAPFIKLIQQHAIPFKNGQPDYNALSNWIGNKQFVLIGDSTHGTREFYTLRAQITQYLIQHQHFNIVVIEGNWPGGYRVNRYINHQLMADQNQVLEDFKHILPWVWRNRQIVEFIEWLRQFNSTRKPRHRVQFAGMDLFSLFPSIDKVVRYLQHHGYADSEPLNNMIQCFNQHQHSFYGYGKTVNRHPDLSCRNQVDQVVKLLLEKSFPDHTRVLNKTLFNTKMNALTMQAAEQYIRLTHAEQSTLAWNGREKFMFNIIEQIINRQQTSNPKFIIWTHNTHVGDAKAFLDDGQLQLSLGQLLREKYSEKAVFLLGSLTYRGTVLSSRAWNESPLCMKLPNAVPPSFAWQFHQANMNQLIMKTHHNPGQDSNSSNLPGYLRLVGVVYNPDQEAQSNYFLVNLNQLFDAVMFIDSTRATQALDTACTSIHGYPH
ncbi:MAG: erythromycin esterase family protein [Gammaproteobacteria bacterium]|nr:erythromycin esterase family protein [Gammaproteobacteria bacterium]